MAKEAKGAVHMEARKSIGSLEASEFQRRWNEQHYKTVNKKPLHWYDITRKHLNFEIAKGGQIRKIGTSKPIEQRFAERLAELGVTPNPVVNKRTPNLDKMQNQVVEFIFGGDHDTLQKLAFGSQVIDYAADGTADNNYIHREQGIEQWAKDIYDFVAQRYGEDNIIGFDVHLDETTSHIHCTIVPVVPRVDKKTGEIRDVVSFKDIFGKTIEETQNSMRQLHTDLFAQVNHKYGLMRGDPVELTGAYHKNKYEMYYRLNRELPELEMAARDLRATIADLERQIRNLQDDQAVLDEQLRNSQITRDQYDKESEKILARTRQLKEKIVNRNRQLLELDNDIQAKREQQAQVEAETNKSVLRNEEVQKEFRGNINTLVKGAMFDELMAQLYDFFTKLPAPSKEALQSIDGTLVAELFAGTLMDVVSTAGGIVLAGIDGATTVTPSGGGGGGNNDLPKKKDDEDWAQFARRATKYARSMPSPIRRKR